MPPTSFLASLGMMWFRQKNSKSVGKGSNIATVKLIASKPLENKTLKMETNVEEKFWPSIISISRVSAGKI